MILVVYMRELDIGIHEAFNLTSYSTDPSLQDAI